MSILQQAFNRRILSEVAHRPWPMPSRPWLMTQTWNDLLFAHWPVHPAAIAAKVPDAFELDVFDGQAWLGVVPFHMTNVAPRYVPALPWLSAFPELNVRTYVRVDAKPGVYFFSLDAGNPVAVGTARILLNLPYYSAEMNVELHGDVVRYRSWRKRSAAAAELLAEYAPSGPPVLPAEGSLEYFLTERYCLYGLDHRNRPYRLDIHHPPWPLQPAYARFERHTVAEASAGVPVPADAPLLHFAKRQDMVAWGPERLDSIGV